LIGRRDVLVGIGGAMTALALGACGSDGGGDPAGASSAARGSTSPASRGPISTTAANDRLALPAHVPYSAVTPDLPASDSGVPAGFYHYPSNPPALFSGKPGDGGTLTMMLQATSIAIPESDNHWWQLLNSMLNVKIKYQIAPSNQYTPKFQTTLAGNDLPDIVQVPTVPGLPQVLNAKFADLSAFLSGDAVKQYPGLASIPSSAWKVATLNGHIWGIPQARPTAGSILNMRGDLLEKYGLTPSVRSGADFVALCKELTDSKHGRWALGAQPTYWVLPAVLEMMGAPNVWRESGGKFVSQWEVPEAREAIGVVAQMWKAGYIHPDSFATSNTLSWWSSGTTALYFQNVAGWPGSATGHPDWKVDVIPLPKWAGGGLAKKALGAPAYGVFAGFKKASEERIKQLLKIADHLAAPFGSQEYIAVNYGAVGADYTLDGTDPVQSKAAAGEKMPIDYVGSQKFTALYAPGASELVKGEHDYLSTVLPTGVENPALGLYSETALGDGARANSDLISVVNDVIQGRKGLSDWDAALKSWQDAGGAQMAKEYEQAYSEANS
jgi:putative aldouronate transport system substrate-binding protein